MTEPEFESTNQTYRNGLFLQFRVGTCEGLWRATETHYEILAVVNKQKGNGHFKRALWWFEQSCRRDGRKFLIREVWNPWLAYKCWKNGYKWIPMFNWEKTWEKTYQIKM